MFSVGKTNEYFQKTETFISSHMHECCKNNTGDRFAVSLLKAFLPFTTPYG